MNPCELLDDYLAHDLRGDQQSVFVEHLTDCQSCRDAVSEQQKLAVLLVEACQRFEPVPKIRHRQSSFSARRLTAVAAAIVAMFSGLWWFTGPTRQHEAAEQVIAKADPSPVTQDHRRVSVTFPKDAHVTAVQIQTDSPNVTVYWVFPERASQSN